MKNKETLEEAAKEFANNSAITNYEEGINVGKYQGFIEGAKWQQEQDTKKYSEQEVIAFGEFIFKHSLLTHTKGVKSLFEQFKKEIRL